MKQLLLSVYELDKQYSDGSKPKKYRVRVSNLLYGDRQLDTVGRINNNIVFEVRSSEAQHNTPHFHITIRGKGSGSYDLETLQPIESNIRKADEKSLLVWAREHRSEMVDLWNMFHGHRIKVA